MPVFNGYGATEAHYIAIEGVPFHGHISDAAGQPCGSEIGIMNPSRELVPDRRRRRNRGARPGGILRI